MLIYFLPFIILWSTPAHSKEEIVHTQCLVSVINNLYLSNRFSDGVLIVDGEKLPVHRAVLASHSEYFRILFYGGLKETYEFHLNMNEVPLSTFKILLKYIYTSRIHLNDLEDKEVFELMTISDFYVLITLNLSLQEYLKKNIQVDNVCSFFEMSLRYQYEALEVESLNFIEKKPLKVLRSKDFLSLSSEPLQKIISRDSFFANELVIFHAVCRWISENQNDLDTDTKIKVLSAVRYPLMNFEELSEAKNSQLGSTFSYAIQFRNPSEKPQLRGESRHNWNLFAESFSVTNAIDNGTMIMLNYPSTINYNELMLKHGNTMNPRCYSYYIEVSMDMQAWTNVLDYSNYNCRSVQHLWIHPRIVRYLRFVGTKSTSNATFEILVVKYKTKNVDMVEIKNGLVVPKITFNVASSNNYAVVIKGENSVKNTSLLDEIYDYWMRYVRYTWHQLGSGSIVIHLAQPYILSSIRLLLWGGDDQSYSYTVESSTDEEWEMIADKSNELARSWQVLLFESRPILYIRITGVSNSSGIDFRCIYLEAPAEEPDV